MHPEDSNPPKSLHVQQMMIARDNAMRPALHRAFEDAVVIRIRASLEFQSWSDPHRNLP